MVGVANELRHWNLARCGGTAQQFQTCLIRQFAAFFAVHLLVRQHAIVPGALAATRNGHDVIDVSLVGFELATRVLANSSIALPDGLGAKFRAAFGHAVKSGQNQNRGHPNGAMDGSDGVVTFIDRQFHPVLPADGRHVIVPGDVQGGGIPGGHHAESLSGRFDGDSLPVSIQHQNGRFVQNVTHGFAFEKGLRHRHPIILGQRCIALGR